jgi:hypothetical protein
LHFRNIPAQPSPGLPGSTLWVLFTSLDCAAPPHVHGEREAKTCKFWLEPLALARNQSFTSHELNVIRGLIRRHLELSWRSGINTVANSDPSILSVRVTRDEIIADLSDGRVISVPLAWSWRLSDATPAQRANLRLIGTRQGVHWPDVDEDISVEGLLRGSPAPRPKMSAIRLG